MAKRLKLREVVPEPAPADAQQLADKEELLEGDDRMLMMEYCANGDLKDLIQKCVDMDVDVSPKYLWLIFGCRKMLIELNPHVCWPGFPGLTSDTDFFLGLISRKGMCCYGLWPSPS